jgi:hypothetical protein
MEPVRRRSDLVLLFGAIGTVAIAHAASLGNHLVSDDWVFVYPRSLAETFGYFFTSIIPQGGDAFWLRPLPMFLFWLENVLHHGTEWLPHLTNILLHLVNVFLVWKIVTILPFSGGAGKRPGNEAAAFAACLIYGLHPLTVGSVDWVAARFDVASVTFGLAGLYWWMKWDAGKEGNRDVWIASALLVCSLLSKEQGIVFFAACGFLALVRVLAGTRKDAWRGIAAPAVIGAAYFLYRLAIFGGVGGYVTARHGLSIVPPVGYFAAVFIPWPNLPPSWRFTWEFGAASALAAALVLTLRSSGGRKPSSGDPGRVLALAVLLILGVLTTASSPGLTFAQIVGHAESRFALIPVTAAALLAGAGISCIRSEALHRTMLAFLLAWSIAAAWRTTVQIQAWGSAGIEARSIIDQTLGLVPDPPHASRIILVDIPRNTPQYAYIFGIGLDYALLTAYHRTDLLVNRFPTRDDLNHADPDRDAVLQFHPGTGLLERLHGKRVSRDGRTN